MSTSYDEVISRLKSKLPLRRLNRVGRSVGFVKRLRAIRAGLFVWAVVLSRFAACQPGFAEARRWYEELGGKRLFPRPFQIRFKAPAAVALFKEAFASAIEPWRIRALERCNHALAQHFPDIVAIDSTQMMLRDKLRRIFKGSGMPAGIKVLLSISVFGLLPLDAQMVAACRCDMRLFPPLQSFLQGSLLLFDKGFVDYERLRDIAAASLHYLCPMRLNGNPVVVKVRSGPARFRKALRKHPHGVPLRELLPRNKRISRPLELQVYLKPNKTWRVHERVYTRLVILPGRKGAQHPYLTTLPADAWKPSAVRELYRLRWQIELVFKEAKQYLNLESLPSSDPHAIQVFAWASLIALAVSRTLGQCLDPDGMIGLASRVRPAQLTAALAASALVLAAVVRADDDAVGAAELLVRHVLRGLRTRPPPAPDSFSRLAQAIKAA